MDKLHKPTEQCFVSELVNLRDFLASATAAYNKTMNPADADSIPSEGVSDDPEFLSGVLRSHMAKQLGCDPTIVDELSALCHPERLLCGGELSEADVFEGRTDTDAELQTVKLVSEDIKKRKDNGTYRQQYMNVCKFARWNFGARDTYTEPENLCTVRRVLYEPQDIVLTVLLMKPYNRPLQQHEIRLGRLLKADSCFYVCGQNRLTDLRDMIQCQSDLALCQDYSHTPRNVSHQDFSKEFYPSGFFFIDDTFYNDMRTERVVGERVVDEASGQTEPVVKHCQPTDLSQPIREFYASKSSKSERFGPFQTAAMESTQFIDLIVRFGQPYMYLHQGRCEHLLVFTDCRLMALDDPQDVTSYPIQVYKKPRVRVPCCACAIYTAKWVTYNNDRLPFDKGFFCETCFLAFNYDADGNKVGDFKAVPYFDRNALR